MSGPAWYHGLWPPNALASTIRDGWFNALGSTQGFPYNADLFFLAHIFLNLVADDTTVPQGTDLVPVPATVEVLDAGGNVVGSWTGTLTSAQAGVDVAGSFSQGGTYSLVITIGTYTAVFTHSGSSSPLSGIPGTALADSNDYYFLEATLSQKAPAGTPPGTLPSPNQVTPIEQTGPAPVA